jgi:hypothetical protein
MGTASKSLALVLVALFLTSLVVLPPATLKAQSTTMTSAPPTEWQQRYGNYRTESVSNVIQTIDGGYAFLDLGWTHGFTLQPATFYKVDSSGEIQWQKTIDFFIGDSVVQTSDGGYEISGDWNTYGTTYETTPTLIKTDSNGNMQWYENYTSTVPDFDVNNSRIQTSDGGYAFLQSESITKIDSDGNVQWVKNITFPLYDGDIQPTGYSKYYSMIETKDGALVAIGVETIAQSWEGYIYLLKTEAFLPLPSPTQLPTPLPTTITAVSQPVLTPLIVALALVIAVVVGLLIYRRHRKPVTLSK